MTEGTRLNSVADQPTEAKYRGVILGAAFGDALGWPYESRARNASNSQPRSLSLTSWVKQSGGRFQPHEETIPSGSYSDDTQLIIAVSRSRLQNRRWWDYFSRIELPFWTSYQRGGGSATIRAAKLWLKGIQPWASVDVERQKYFNAGGNGVAMRISPHVLIRAGAPFDEVARDILIDGVITHGHPQALVGALAYGYALWFALTNPNTLEYGQLIREVLNNQDSWAVWRDIEDVWPNWLESASAHGFHDEWAEAVGSQMRQLDIARRSLDAGALSVDQQTLEAIGCFDKRILGAGTVAASAAIFLASRYAASPMEGVAAAAFSKGADTDTIASMTAALAGAISGFEWLGSLVRELQDFNFLVELSAKLRDPIPVEAAIEPIGEKFMAEFFRFLEGKGAVAIPAGLPRRVHVSDMIQSKSDKLRTRSWILEAEDAQTIVVKKLDRPRGLLGDAKSQDAFAFEDIVKRRKPAIFAGIGLFAANLEKSISFYRDLLGLPVVRQTSRLIQLGSHLVLRPSDGNIVAGTGTIVYIQVDDLYFCVSTFRDGNLTLQPIKRDGNRLSFICRDPDGRTVEVFQHLDGN